MEDIKVIKYTPQQSRIWNEFVSNSRNGTFLLHREYIDYHEGRLTDCSLMIYLRDKLSALLPANLDGNRLQSHGGLTYGGLVLPMNRVDGSDVLLIMHAVCDWCSNNGISRLIYKPIPYIYHKRPAQEDLYALFRMGARRTVCNLSSVINMAEGVRFDMSKRQQVRKAESRRPILSETKDYTAFWHLLEETLAERHGARPVHSLAEIELLHSRFPNNIRLHTVSDEEGLQAGIVIFNTGIVAHSQYTASTARARSNYLVTWLYHKLITEVYTGCRYFDFGTSNNDAGRVLDDGLLRQKFSMGGSGVAYETYSLDFRH